MNYAQENAAPSVKTVSEAEYRLALAEIELSSEAVAVGARMLDEGTNFLTASESIVAHIEASKEEGLQEKEATAISRHFNYLTVELGMGSTQICASENFTDAVSRVAASEASAEGIKKAMKTAFEVIRTTIKKLISKAVTFVKTFVSGIDKVTAKAEEELEELTKFDKEIDEKKFKDKWEGTAASSTKGGLKAVADSAKLAVSITKMSTKAAKDMISSAEKTKASDIDVKGFLKDDASADVLKSLESVVKDPEMVQAAGPFIGNSYVYWAIPNTKEGVDKLSWIVKGGVTSVKAAKEPVPSKSEIEKGLNVVVSAKLDELSGATKELDSLASDIDKVIIAIINEDGMEADNAKFLKLLVTGVANGITMTNTKTMVLAAKAAKAVISTSVAYRKASTDVTAAKAATSKTVVKA